MADIKTILRELGVILGYLLSKYKLTFTEELIDVKTYLDFIRKYCKNISECNSEIQKIEELDDFIIHKGIIKNGLMLGKLLDEKLKLEGDIYWLGAKVKSKYPFDIKIGKTGISLKEDSHIIKNPPFSDYLNALVQPTEPFKKVHVFRVFAPHEFKLWYDHTYNKLFQEFNNHKDNEIIYNYPKEGTFIKKCTRGLIFGDNSNSVEIGNTENLDEISFNSRLGGFIFEHKVSKWVKNNLKCDDTDYDSGENLVLVG